jgi:hypothetical protein
MRIVRILLLREVSQNLPGEEIIDFFVAWNRLCRPSLWIVVNVVLASMPDENRA